VATGNLPASYPQATRKCPLWQTRKCPIWQNRKCSIWQTRNLDFSYAKSALVALNLSQMYRYEVPTSPAVLNLENEHAGAETLISAWMSDDVAGFFSSPQHAAQQDRSASIWRHSHVCFCGQRPQATATQREVGRGGRGCGRRRATVSHRSWRRARATGRGGRRAMVRNRGGKRRRRKDWVIDKRGCAVSTGGSWLRLSAEGSGRGARRRTRERWAAR
jgi:hypothetical protein